MTWIWRNEAKHRFQSTIHSLNHPVYEARDGYSRKQFVIGQLEERASHNSQNIRITNGTCADLAKQTPSVATPQDTRTFIRSQAGSLFGLPCTASHNNRLNDRRVCLFPTVISGHQVRVAFRREVVVATGTNWSIRGMGVKCGGLEYARTCSLIH